MNITNATASGVAPFASNAASNVTGFMNQSAPAYSTSLKCFVRPDMAISLLSGYLVAESAMKLYFNDQSASKAWHSARLVTLLPSAMFDFAQDETARMNLVVGAVLGITLTAGDMLLKMVENDLFQIIHSQ